MVDFSKIGQALTGISMGMQGRGAEFAQGLQAQQQQQQEEARRKQLEMMQTKAIGGRIMLNAINDGKWDVAQDFLFNAIAEAGDSADDDMISLATMFRKGEREKIKNALDVNDQQSVLQGLLPKTGDQSQMTAEQKEFASLTKDMSQEDIERAKRIKLGLDARASSRMSIDEAEELARRTSQARGEVKLETERGLSSILSDRAKNKKLKEGEAARIDNFIDQGIDAAGQLPEIERGLMLLDKVATGGLTAKSKVVSDFFGTTSGDVGELNNILAGQVLSALQNFSGAISDSERQFLEKTQASMDQGTAANRRILTRLQNMLKSKVNRARKAAKVSGDTFSLELFEDPVSIKSQRSSANSQIDFTKMSDDDLLSGW